MTDYRLLQQPGTSKRLLENTNGYLLEGDLAAPVLGTITARPQVAGFRFSGPAPNVEDHILAVSRMEKLSSVPTYKQAVYLPGGGGLETSWQGGTDTNPLEVNEVVRDCVDRGIRRHRLVTIPTDWTWGDAEMNTRIDDMLTYAEANYGFSPPYHLIGVSMGTLCALNWAVRNLDLVASLSLMLGVVNPQGMTDGRLTGGTGHPNLEPPVVDPTVAYAGAVPDAYNPLDRAAEYAGVPIKMWQSNNDSVAYLSEATAFAAINGATIVNIGNQSGGAIFGHGLDSGFTFSQVGDWLIAND